MIGVVAENVPEQIELFDSDVETHPEDNSSSDLGRPDYKHKVIPVE